MPRLYQTMQWSDEDLSSTTNFLLNCLHEAERISFGLGPIPARQSEREPNRISEPTSVRRDRSELLTELIELLCVTDQTPSAVKFMSDPSWILFGRNAADGRFESEIADVDSFVRVAMFAALSKSGQLFAGERELLLTTARGTVQLGRLGALQWYQALPALTLIALATKSDRGVIEFLLRSIHATDREFGIADLLSNDTFTLLGVFSDLSAAQEYRLSFDFPFGPNFISGMGMLLSLEQRYVHRIAEMSADLYHWNLLRPAGDLIEWSVLLTRVALLRLGFDSERFIPGQAADEQLFLYLLADELA